MPVHSWTRQVFFLAREWLRSKLSAIVSSQASGLEKTLCGYYGTISVFKGPCMSKYEV